MRLGNWMRGAGVLLIMALVAPGATGCDRGAEEAAEGRDWRPVTAKIDRALVERVLVEQGWTLAEGEPMEMTMTAEDVRSMGGQAEGDTHMLNLSATREGRRASVTLTTYPGDVKPARGDRGRVMGSPMLAAGPRGVGVTISDDESGEEDADAADALLDAIIAAAEAAM